LLSYLRNPPLRGATQGTSAGWHPPRPAHRCESRGGPTMHGNGTAGEGFGPAVCVFADGEVTGLSVHVRQGTPLSTRDFPPEGRAVLNIGSGVRAVTVFVRTAELAELIDVLNESYTRLSSLQRPLPTPCAPSEPAGARPRPRVSQRLRTA
jgi:hypothetical protein